jgi:hypothetical protein
MNESVHSEVVEVAQANSMLPLTDDIISYEVSDTMDNEEIEIVFIRCEDMETSDQYKSSTDISTDADTFIQGFLDMEVNLFQLCNNITHDMKDSMPILIPDDDTDKVLDNTDGLDDMVISDDDTDKDMDISDTCTVNGRVVNQAFEHIKSRYGYTGILMGTRLFFQRLQTGHAQSVHSSVRFVDQQRMFDPGGITSQSYYIQ